MISVNIRATGLRSTIAPEAERYLGRGRETARSIRVKFPSGSGVVRLICLKGRRVIIDDCFAKTIGANVFLDENGPTTMLDIKHRVWLVCLFSILRPRYWANQAVVDFSTSNIVDVELSTFVGWTRVPSKFSRNRIPFFASRFRKQMSRGIFSDSVRTPRRFGNNSTNLFDKYIYIYISRTK